MPSLENKPDNILDQMVVKIKELIVERNRLRRMFTSNDQMVHYFEDVSSYGLFRNMRDLSSQILQIENDLMVEVDSLEKYDPNHPLAEYCQDKIKKVA